MTDEKQSRVQRLNAVRFDRAPRILGIVVFCVGALALISAAIPHGAIHPKKPLQWLVTETPVVALTIGGLAMMVLSLGLVRRLRAAWALTVLVAFHGLAATLFLRSRPLEFGMYLALLVILLATRKSFFRRSSLLRIIIPRIWILASLCALVLASFFALLWVSHQSGFVEARFVDLLIDPSLGVAGRPIALAGIILGLTVLYFGVASPAWPKPRPANDEDFEHVTALLQMSDEARPDNVLAYVGDKSIFFGPQRQAALAYADIKGNRIAMGPPIGPRDTWKETLEGFRQEAESKGLRPAIYSAPPDLLPILHDLKFTFEKIGENAILNLPDFTLSGRKREVIRRSRRKLAERQGATFELSLPPHRPRVLDALQTVSDRWLDENGGREKSFSLGRFDPRFLDHCPIGIVEIRGEVVAFGSLLVAPDKSWAGIDLMRYDPRLAITNTMDFLLVELILWARDSGYGKFDLAMAPLSGLVQEDVAPLFARIGQFVFERGERFYNFQGLRRFKQKFNPDWEPRYIAAPGYWSLPIVLAKVAFLTNGQTIAAEDGDAA
ncbi:MAG: phosphatidylglycerol lysyltransferase domain-containing protein [Pseudomonadota bacterium]